MLNNPIYIRPISIDIKINKNFSSRYINPPASVEIDEKYLKYRNAEKLAKDIKIDKKSRYFVIIDGSFYFGDFIEALIVENDWNCLNMTISTLSMNQNNVDSLANILQGDFVQNLNLIVSDITAKSREYQNAAESVLGLAAYPEFNWMGFTSEQWIYDIQNAISGKDKESQKMAIKARLQDLISVLPEDVRKMQVLSKKPNL